MKLVDLDPRWVGFPHATSRFYYGVTYRCPDVCGSRLAAFFYPPIDPEGLEAAGMNWSREIAAAHCGVLWIRDSGDTFETLTLSPSVDVSRHGHWHGHIRNGEIQ